MPASTTRRLTQLLPWEIAVTKPIAITQPASDITATSARLQGKIQDDGGADSYARFRYRRKV